MTLPTFLVIGAQKSGTTSLYRYLQGHPDVFLPDWKEPGFFVEEQTWTRGLEWYESLFRGAGDAKARGEASTAYTMFPFFAGVPERIRSVVPDVRLVYVLRDPVERMRSAYVHALSTGAEHRPIGSALLDSSTYALISSYALQLEQYLDHFDRSQILVVLSSRLSQAPVPTLHAVQDFLGISRWEPPDAAVRYHRSVAKRAPRHGARVVGDVMVRMVHRVGRYVPTAEPFEVRGRLLTRGIRPQEIEIEPELRRRLSAVIAPDLRRLRDLAAPDVDPAELDAWGVG